MLFDRVIELGKYSEVDAAKVMFLLISTLDWLHAQGVLHRDLKPENVMLNQGSSANLHPATTAR
jgi:serine/threonine protein kinase|eukprot:COSAG01_NODE_20337_length_958_cov_28.932480_3_plen_64_part_00